MVNPLAYVKSSYAELAKTTWPSRSTIIRHTLLVVISIGLATLLIGIIDAGLAVLVKMLVDRS